ncbi:PP0621 family protein [Halorhodospira halophila]|uniref:MYND finger n=1 Tax=Halorhodospira halophila (strain DSM 244 / SL1) TaxID=349124 RepID=A1WZ93_HALHL|nr:PP0621 family protein [Halorhodospira halophila]ABM63005.1 conserved hypothetical protein [Halorhodospira halophila SL1]MBK1727874.1 hypothetical protein [Halorhodospira halophila]
MLGQILLVILIILAWIGARSLLQKRLRQDSEERGQTGSSGESAHTEEMVRCARCGVFLPRSAAYPREGVYFCSPEHRQLGRDEPPVRPR